MRPVLIHHVHLTLPAEHKRGQVSAFTAKACPDRKPNAGVFSLQSSWRRAGWGRGREDDGGGRREGTLGWGFEQGDVVVVGV